MKESFLESEKFDDYARTYGTGETIFEQGDPGDSFYVIREGTVDVVSEEESRPVVLATLGPGEVFGEMALIGNVQERTATVKAQTRTMALKFSREKFLHFLSDSEQFRQFILELLVRRVQESNNRLQRLENYANSMLDSTHLMLAMMDKLDWYGETRTTVDVTISEELVRKKFDLDQKTVHRMLSINDSTELTRFPSHIQDDILDGARTILDAGFSKISLEFTASQYDSSRTFGGKLKSLDEMLKATKQLTSILNNSERLTKTQYKKIFDQYRKLRDQFEEERSDRSGRSDPRTVHKLNAHLDALNRKLREFDLHELDEAEE